MSVGDLAATGAKRGIVEEMLQLACGFPKGFVAHVPDHRSDALL